ncbi:hypothetical protein ACHAWX_003015 [Stephanocyclus meneghinianus]
MKLFIVVAAAIFRYSAAAPRRIRTVEFGRLLQNDRLERLSNTHVGQSLDASMSLPAPQPPHQLPDSLLSLNYQFATVNDDMIGLSVEALMSMSYSHPQNDPALYLPPPPFPPPPFLQHPLNFPPLPEENSAVQVTQEVDEQYPNYYMQGKVAKIAGMLAALAVGLVSGLVKQKSDKRKKEEEAAKAADESCMERGEQAH